MRSSGASDKILSESQKGTYFLKLSKALAKNL